MGVEIEGTIDLNKFHELASKDIGKLIAGAAVKGAVIFNNSNKPVTFHVYNYSDLVNWVPAQKTTIAPGSYGTVAASGVFFKVHANNNHDEEFLVAPGKAYVYSGPGRFEAAS
ncbi:hypothetical protein [Thalassospira sp.]|uniref:hypothetical protein n=1 Tax=Thalassospira sp. TaxID=1912094 RepID=UPI0027333BBA|nr:hypothetical protein [Thalassospira sp.]MDP2699277.1 hypothetical protein [Thalassospira sp.]